jgi:DNA polymerase-3 subunit alpha
VGQIVAEFAHLHLHTEYSLLDGMGRIDQYIARAKQHGMQHIAISDHGVMYGALEWYEAVKAAELHPIVGVEAYLAETSMKARERKNYHLLLLAENETGYRNLLKLTSKAALEGFYYRPRIDLDLLQQHHEGVIATSACLGGPVANNFLHNQPEKARDFAGKLAEIFGPDHFYIEVQDHGLKEQQQVNQDLIPLARSLDLPLVATNDVHYCAEADAAAQDILVCVQTNTTINDTKRLKQDTNQLYFKSADEMARIFGHLPEAMSNTIRIAEMCSLDLGFKGYHLPEFDVPVGFDSETYLRHLCTQGVLQKYGTAEGKVGERLDYELGVINSMGFTNYFLIVWDFVKFAKDNGILVGPGRGSSAGSIVTDALNITGLDPLKYELIFERFLNPSRISMPDIDIDFADERRGEVIEYVVRKYGDDRVAQIVTFGKLKAKASLRDVGRAMGYSFGDTDRVARLVPNDPKTTIDKALASVPELAKLYDGDDAVRELIDTAKKVDGLSRHSSTHAGGVVISRDPLIEHVPLQYAGGKSGGEVTTQFTMEHLEGLGLLKMDFLGLRTLSVLGRAVELARQSGHDISLESIPMEDDLAYEMLRRGETVGVFQLEGGSTTRMTIDVAPENFDDLTALMALIRPGPMQMAPEYIARRHGRMEIEYLHEGMAPILKQSYGVALYQEQVMQIASALAGFSMAEADGLRKAMGKKLPAVMAKFKDRFIEGCVGNGITRKLAQEIFDMIERFAGYGFPKAHSAAYAVIAAQTAYLKAHYPVEFMAALMSTEIGNTEKNVFNIAECRRVGIPVLPPDINHSDFAFTVELNDEGVGSVRFGLGAIKGVGAGAIAAIVAARKEQPDGVFPSLDALCNAIDWSAVTRKVLELLAKVGALDVFGERNAVLTALEGVIASAQARHKAAAKGQIGLFGAEMLAEASGVAGALPNVPAADHHEVLRWEKESLGLYLSAHPLNLVLESGLPDGVHLIAGLADLPPNHPVHLIGMVNTIRRITTKTNRTMAVITLEDLSGTIELVAFPDTYERYTSQWIEDRILDVRGKVDFRNDAPQVIGEEVTDDIPILPKAAPSLPAVEVSLPLTGERWRDIELMQALDGLLRRHEGEQEVRIVLKRGSKRQSLRSRSRRVEWSDGLAAELSALLGGGGGTVASLIAASRPAA